MATATSANATVTKVEFFDGAAKLGEDTSSPYSFVWNGASAGAHALTAKATNNANVTATSTVVNIAVTAAAGPSVVITSPANNSSFVSGPSITIAAAATSPNATVTKVEFFDGTTKLGEDTSSPYSYVWNGASTGVHTVTAKVTNNANATATSTAVNVTVTAAPAGDPIVEITSPANNATLAPGKITVTANASDPGGSVKIVEFFAGTAKIGEDTSSPYSIIWPNAVVGSYNLTAKVTDNQNKSVTSAVVTVNVVDSAIPSNKQPEVTISSPGTEARFVSGSTVVVEISANDPDGNVAVVELFINGSKFEEDKLPPYSFNWTNVGEGDYTLTAVATDNLDSKGTSQPVRVIVSPVTADGEGDNLAASIPRFFSPNGDGQGDVWDWGTSESLSNASVAVFNRAGAKVYEAAPYKSNWDGRSTGGQALQDGDYYYVATLADGSELRGAVRIIR